MKFIVVHMVVGKRPNCLYFDFTDKLLTIFYLPFLRFLRNSPFNVGAYFVSKKLGNEKIAF